jgi:hypothetical protein
MRGALFVAAVHFDDPFSAQLSARVAVATESHERISVAAHRTGLNHDDFLRHARSSQGHASHAGEGRLRR